MYWGNERHISNGKYDNESNRNKQSGCIYRSVSLLEYGLSILFINVGAIIVHSLQTYIEFICT